MNTTPLEAQEQRMIFQWAALRMGRYPELRLLYHIPNGGWRNEREAHSLKTQGVKAGVPDLMLPVARNGYHGLYIELKRGRGGRVSAVQEEWIKALNEQGYLAVVAHGFEEARRTLEEYLRVEDGE